jgi:hypothetical protein
MRLFKVFLAVALAVAVFSTCAIAQTTSTWNAGRLVYKDQSYSPAVSFWYENPVPPIMAIQTDPSTGILIQEHFCGAYLSSAPWVGLLDTGCTITVASGLGGWWDLMAHSDANDELFLSYGISGAAAGGGCFKVAAGSPIWYETQVYMTEGNTNDQAAIVGMFDEAVLNATIVDGGATPAASLSGMFFFKAKDATVWTCWTSAGATQVTTTTTATRSTSAATPDVLSMYCNGAAVYFYINASLVATHTTGIPTAAFRPAYGVKGVTASEHLFTNYMWALQTNVF